MQALIIQEVADKFRNALKNPEIKRDDYDSKHLREVFLSNFDGLALGSGAFGAVCEITNLPGKVIKIMADPHDMWIQWAIICRQNPALPFRIEVDYLEVNEEQSYALAVMPKYDITVEYKDADFDELRDQLYESYSRQRQPNIFEAGVIQLAKKLDARFDLHNENFARDGKRLVLLDPWTGYGKSQSCIERLSSEQPNMGFCWFKKK